MTAPDSAPSAAPEQESYLWEMNLYVALEKADPDERVSLTERVNDAAQRALEGYRLNDPNVDDSYLTWERDLMRDFHADQLRNLYHAADDLLTAENASQIVLILAAT